MSQGYVVNLADSNSPALGPPKIIAQPQQQPAPSFATTTPPPEDYTMLHTVAQPYEGHEEEQRGTEFQAPEEPLAAWHQPAAEIVHVGEKRHGSVNLEDEARKAGATVPQPKERPKVTFALDEEESPRIQAVQQQEGKPVRVTALRISEQLLQPETPPARISTPEKRPAATEVGADEKAENKDVAAYAAAMAPFVETDREVKAGAGVETEEQPEERNRITMHSLEALTEQQDAAAGVDSAPSAERFYADMEALRKKSPDGDLVISPQVYKQFEEPLKHVEQLKEKTGALQSIYRRKASMPSPESTRPTTLEEKMSPMPIGHQPVPLDPVAGGDISDMPIQEYEAFEEEDFGVEPSEEESGMTKTETAGDASRPMPMRQLRDAKSVQDLGSIVSQWVMQLWTQYDGSHLLAALLQTVFVVLLAAVYASGHIIEDVLHKVEEYTPAKVKKKREEAESQEQEAPEEMVGPVELEMQVPGIDSGSAGGEAAATSISDPLPAVSATKIEEMYKEIEQQQEKKELERKEFDEAVHAAMPFTFVPAVGEHRDEQEVFEELPKEPIIVAPSQAPFVVESPAGQAVMEQTPPIEQSAGAVVPAAVQSETVLPTSQHAEMTAPEAMPPPLATWTQRQTPSPPAVVLAEAPIMDEQHAEPQPAEPAESAAVGVGDVSEEKKKKKRGKIHGPLHKLAKEIKNVFKNSSA